MIRLRRLRLVGTVKNYEVSFLDEAGKVRPLSIVAGEISTGKSSILDFIDYCLGASGHPSQIEVQRQARAAQLEIEISGRTLTIERGLFASEQFVWLHECAIPELSTPHPSRRMTLGPPSDSKSLNWLLLSASALEGTVLKQAPTKATSATDFLSFRDVLDLSYLDESRLNAKQLLHEDVFMKRLKLQQLVEVVFGVHDQELAAMGDRLAMLESERALQRREIDALRLFLEEQQTLDRATLTEQRTQVSRDGQDAVARLKALDANMSAETASAQQMRTRYAAAQRATRQAAAVARDRDALLRRLLPLRGQYSEDERKLVFFAEARLLFDPLAVETCPSCLQALQEKPTIVGGHCSMCDQALVASAENTVDVDAERRSINARLRSIDRYIEEVDRERRAAENAVRDAAELEAGARAELDSDLGARLAPFVADRDRLVRGIENLRGRHAEIDRQLGYRDAIDRRSGELDALQARLDELRQEQQRLQAMRPEKDLVLAELSGRFGALLEAFGFPKLNDPEPPYLNAKFHPYVRGVPYEELRSRGATTLVAVAWQLTMFELAVELHRPHPGFLMIDSPQNGLKPSEGEAPSEEFDEAEIADRLWLHIRNWTADHSDAQLIVVDNLPPARAAEHVVVRYSGNAAEPPYGFIDNETGNAGPEGS